MQSTRKLSAFVVQVCAPPMSASGFFLGGRMRTAFLIDGFNVYHSIKSLPPEYHWLNYKALCAHFLKEADILTSVTYFTALALWKEPASNRHRIFIGACEALGVNVVLGKFKEKHSKCPLKIKNNIDNCDGNITRHEEKETDVNIALYAYRTASLNLAEQIFFVTGDTDMIPAIRLIKNDFPEIKIGVIFPYGRANRELKMYVDLHYKVTVKTMTKFIMPIEIKTKHGKSLFCPQEWRK